MAVEHRLHTAGNHTGRLPGKGKSSQSRDGYEISCGPGEEGLVLFLLTGASGTGKSSARQAIEADLLPRMECVELRHLGPVPTDPDVAWRQRMAERAVARASLLDAEGRDLGRGDPEELRGGTPSSRSGCAGTPKIPPTCQRYSPPVGDRVLRWIDDVRSGSAPVFRRSAG
jgi:hypothetical protein